MTNTGHDGWYNSIVVDGADTVHTASFDPAAFNGDGVLYGRWDGTWSVELAAAGRFDYKNGTSIAVATDGTVYVAFYDDMGGRARLARRDMGGQWDVATVESARDHLERRLFPQHGDCQ